MAVELINGNSYTWQAVVVNILGQPLFSIKSINYEVSQEKTNNYGAGNLPVSRGRGAKEFSASMELAMDELVPLRNAVGGSLVDIPAFDITITYVNGAKTVTDVLKACEFVNDGIDASQGDGELVRSFDLMPANIIFGQ